MSQHVYTSKERSEDSILYANEAVKDDSQILYCPNPKCNAEMSLCRADGMKKSYFRAMPTKPHIENCQYRRVSSFIAEEFDETQFNVDDIFSRLLKCDVAKNKTSSSKHVHKDSIGKKPIRTILQFYDMCLAHKPIEKYNGIEIFKILFDDRSSFFYKNGIFGNKLLCAKALPYPECVSVDTHEISLNVPVLEPKFSIILNIPDSDFFLKLSKELEVKSSDASVLVAGKWTTVKEKDEYKTVVTSLKQIKIL